MATRDTRRTGAIVVLALTVLVGAALVAGPAPAQETTDDGMTTENETMTESVNESTSDDSMMGDGNESMGEGDSMDGSDAMTTEGGGMMTEEDVTTDDGSMDGEETMGEDEMTTEGESMEGQETMGEEEMTEEGMMTEESADQTASGGQPGFGLVIGVVAVLAALGVAIVRRVR